MNKKKITIGVLLLIALVFTFWWGGNSPSLHGWKIEKKTHTINEKSTPTVVPSKKPALSEAPISNTAEVPAITSQPEDTNEAEQTITTSTDTPSVTASPKNKVAAETSSSLTSSSTEQPKKTCTILISCKTILLNMNLLDSEKHEIIPNDGIILDKTTVELSDNDTVFDVLKRETKRNKIHLEFSETPMYNSMYIEGIYNLYEFDCGELSGWMYSVNGEYPNVGCSAYQLHGGENIEWNYTCNLGQDLGAKYVVGK